MLAFPKVVGEAESIGIDRRQDLLTPVDVAMCEVFSDVRSIQTLEDGGVESIPPRDGFPNDRLIGVLDIRKGTDPDIFGPPVRLDDESVHRGPGCSERSKSTGDDEGIPFLPRTSVGILAFAHRNVRRVLYLVTTPGSPSVVGDDPHRLALTALLPGD